jgi:hypothetical protein
MFHTYLDPALQYSRILFSWYEIYDGTISPYLLTEDDPVAGSLVHVLPEN